MEKAKNKQLLHLVLFSFLLVVLSACATPIKKIQVSNKFTEEGQVSQLRVAILPLEGKDEAADYFRKALHVNLMNAGFNVVEKFVVDGVLEKNGWNDTEKFISMPPQKLGEALGADAILYGNVTKWSKFYAVIHSTLVVGLELKLVDARSGELLWAGEQLDREIEGLLKIPTGIVSVLVSPVLFASKEDNLNKLASKVAKSITESLREPLMIKEEDRMNQRIVIASAEEYVSKIENISKEANPVNTVLAENDPVPSSGKSYSKGNNKSSIHNKSMGIKLASLKAKETASKNIKTSVNKKSWYTIQVGAFQDRGNADELFENLKQKGYEVFLALAKIGRELIYKVQVDNFKSKKEAVQFAKELKHKENLSYFIAYAKN